MLYSNCGRWESLGAVVEETGWGTHYACLCDRVGLGIPVDPDAVAKACRSKLTLDIEGTVMW